MVLTTNSTERDEKNKNKHHRQHKYAPACCNLGRLILLTINYHHNTRTIPCDASCNTITLPSTVMSLRLRPVLCRIASCPHPMGYYGLSARLR